MSVDISSQEQTLILKFVDSVTTPKFTLFANRHKDDIAGLSVNLAAPSAIALMRIWARKYNYVLRTQRKNINLYKMSKSVSNTFVYINKLAKETRITEENYTIEAVRTLGLYARKARRLVTGDNEGDDDVDCEEEEEVEDDYCDDY